MGKLIHPTGHCWSFILRYTHLVQDKYTHRICFQKKRGEKRCFNGKQTNAGGGDLFSLLFDFNSALYISLVYLKGNKPEIKKNTEKLGAMYTKKVGFTQYVVWGKKPELFVLLFTERQVV